MKSLYRFADMTVSISSVYDEVHVMCRDYELTSPTEDELTHPDIVVETGEADIQRESKLSDEERAFEGLPPYTFPSPYLETLAVYRKMATQMPDKGVMLLHGSVIAVDGEAYMFTASSGTGKSTHVRLWRELFGERSVMVNDDKPLIRLASLSPKDNSPEEEKSHSESLKDLTDTKLQTNRAIVYGTPWDGKHHLSTNIGVPLKAICILERGIKNEIKKITLDEAYPMLLQQAFRPDNPMLLMKVMQMLTELSGKVGLYRLKCNMDPEAAKVAYEGMNCSILH